MQNRVSVNSTTGTELAFSRWPVAPRAALLAYGSLESSEYGRQTAAYVDALRHAGVTLATMSVEGHHHFSVLDAFCNPQHRFGRAVLELVGLA